jgi:putative membrane protein
MHGFREPFSNFRALFDSEDCFFIGDGKMMGGFGLGFMGIFWVVLIIVGLIFFRQYTKGRKGPEDTGSTPLEILKQRYAKGEIDKQEYETKKRDLS